MKVDGAHDSDKTDVLPATERDRTILDGEKNGWIAGNGCVVDLCTGRVMEQDDGEVLEVEPCFVKHAMPVIDEPINNRAAVQLCANHVKDDVSVNWEGLEGIFHNLECVSTLKDGMLELILGYTDADRLPTWIATSSRGTNVISWTCWTGAEAIVQKEGKWD